MMTLRSLMSTLAHTLVAYAVLVGATQAKTLVYCSEESPEGFSPVLYSGATLDAVSAPIFNRLVEFVRGSMDITPGLAESWDISEDGKVYTFHLRKGVKFHTSRDFTPTRDFNADDVLWSFYRQKDPNHPYHAINGGVYEYFTWMEMDKLIDTLEKVDDHTVRFHLSRPWAPFLGNLALDFASILSAEYADRLLKAKTPEKIDYEPIGTGPFRLVHYQKNSTIRYQAFPEYWGGKQPIDTLIFSITPDASARYAKIKTGECDVMSYPNPADIAKMKQDPTLNVIQGDGLNMGYLAFNVRKKPFDNKLVRQALNLAVNKQAIVDVVYQGAGTPAKNPIPPTIWSYNTEIEDYPYDPQKARELLTEAGYPDGFKTELWIMPVQRPYNPNPRRTAELIEADWAKIGVKTIIKTSDWGEYLKRSSEFEHSVLLLGWTGDSGDPDNFLDPLLGCSTIGTANVTGWCDRRFDDLIQKGKILSDQTARARLYKQAQAIYKEEAPWVMLAYSMVTDITRKNTIGYKTDPFGKHRFDGVDMTE